MDISGFADIRPYNDAQAVEALSRVASDPLCEKLSRYLFPQMPADALSGILRSVRGVDDFQLRVMSPAVTAVLERSCDGVSISGRENMELLKSGRHLLLSNHRDIILDPAILQEMLHRGGIPCTEIAAGNNLITLPAVRDLMRSNRMVIVVRDGHPHEQYEASARFSAYVRGLVASPDGNSLWLAHRQGRAKDGCDNTAQAVLKMLDMSGQGSVVENFSELAPMPLAISYEYEPCVALKAREIVVTRRCGAYRKRPLEDMESIVEGVRCRKGRIHIDFGRPLTLGEMKEAACAPARNDKFRALAALVDARILTGYRIWPTAVAAAMLLKAEEPGSLAPDAASAGYAAPGDFEAYADEIPSAADIAAFSDYISEEVDTLLKAESALPEPLVSEADRELLRHTVLSIFAAPLLRKMGA